MELNKNELKILELFRKELFLKASIREIMKKIHSKSYQRVYDAVWGLVKKNFFVLEKIGNINLISLHLSREAILGLSFLDEKEGNKQSDMDLVVIVPDKEDIVSIQKLVENRTMLFVPPIHLYVFRKKDFVKMLTDKMDNYGKEIVKKKIVLKNAQMFYELVREAIDNGYKS